MKYKITTICILSVACIAQAATTIDPVRPYAYGANIGWVNAAGDTANGAVIGEAFCSGYLYSANCGWISLGDGSPDNGQDYGNDSATDFGVNHDGLGNLTGYAYGANIGWINFEETYGQPKVDLMTGDLSGYVWGANVGWISLDSGKYGVQTDSIAPGPDTDADGIPDWWEYARYGKLNWFTATGDRDEDGVSDLDEYRADTHPNDDTDFLYVTLDPTSGATNTLSWNTRPTRNYRLQTTTNLVTGTWTNTPSGLIHTGSAEVSIDDTPAPNENARFYRVRAIRPLSE